MSLSRQIVPIPVGLAGIDTRSDSKVITGPTLAVADNVTFATPGRLTKRAGTSRPGGLNALAEGLTTAGDSLVRVNATAISSWSPAGGAYIDSLRAAPAVGIDYLYSTGSISDYLAGDYCRCRGLDWMVTERSGGVRAFVRDATTGAVTTSSAVTASVIRPRVLAVGTTACFFYVSGANLKFVASTSGLPGSTLGAEVNVVTNLNASGLYDVVTSGSQILLFYHHTDGSFRHGYVSTSGVAGSLTTETPAAAPVAMTCAVESGSLNYGLVWGIDSTTIIRARLFSSGAAALTAATTLDAAASGGIRNIGAAWATSTLLFVCYELDAALDYNNLVRRATLTTASVVVSGVTWYRHSGMASKPWIDTSVLGTALAYVVLVHSSALQRRFILALSTTSSFGVTANAVVVGSLFGGAAGGLSNYISHVPAVSATGVSRQFGTVLPTRDTAAENRAQKLLTISHASPDAYNFAGAGSEALMAGGQLWTLSSDDGQSVASTNEVGFHFFPENIALSSSNSIGSLTGGATYQYRFYWETVAQGGGVEISSYAGSQSITLGALDDEVQAVIHTLAHTNKSCWLAAYRSTPGPGSIFYRISVRPTAGVASQPNGYFDNTGATADTLTFTDRMSDATLITQAVDYQSSDPVELDNIAPPAHRVIASGNNRVFLSGMEDPNLIWVSKLREATGALAFNDALVISCDAGDGPITGLACVQDSLIVFREHQIYVVGGDGPDNVGLGGEFTAPRIITEDVGCSGQRSICRTPLGVLFKSFKGIYLLGNDLSLSYIGAPVELYNSEAITSAVALIDRHEVRFTTASRTLVYDYLAGQWAVWSIPALSAVSWNGVWAALPSGNGVSVEDSTVYTDNAVAYTQAIETGWIHVAALQSFQRLYKVLFLGSYRAGNHKPRVRLAFDFDTTWVDDKDWDSVSPTGIYQFCIRPSRQKCQAVKIRIEDVASGGTMGDTFTLSEIALEIGLKPGMKPLPASSVIV